jgi:hypothetical protein
VLGHVRQISPILTKTAPAHLNNCFSLINFKLCVLVIKFKVSLSPGLPLTPLDVKYSYFRSALQIYVFIVLLTAGKRLTSKDVTARVIEMYQTVES